MTSLFFAAAVIVALTAIGFRRLRSGIRNRRQPGGSPATAIPIDDYADIDAAVRAASCLCGSNFALRGEGPVRAAPSIRMTRLECRGCGRERRLYFDLSYLHAPHGT